MKRLNVLRLSILAIGLLAEITSHAGVTLTNIFSFNGTNGSVPTFLVRAGDNKFYGITQLGGPNFIDDANADYGGVFSITYDGVFSNLFFFEETNGSVGTYLTPGTDGNFYGTTDSTIFKLNPNGTVANPKLAPGFSGVSYGLVQDHDGTLYGTTLFGGTSGFGTIYKIDTNGAFSTFVTFYGTNGASPLDLFLGADNNFYGLAREGGNGFNGTPYSSGDGTIFRMDRSGNVTNIFLFSDLDDPSWMVQGSDGDLYGVTLYGGTNGAGSIFRITTNGVLVWSFSLNGTNGYGGFQISSGNDGNFYGTTVWGGSDFNGTNISGSGTIFRITPNSSFTSLMQFNGTGDGNPQAIIQGTDGNLYGTVNGGSFGEGAIFKLTLPSCPCTNQLMPTTVATFNSGGSLELPESGLIQATDGMLYGITQIGGTNGLGSVFRTTLSGSLTTLASFNGTNGAYPIAQPVQGPDGNFYGTTLEGGADWTVVSGNGNTGAGTIYRMDSNGVITSLHSFDSTNGSGPGAVGGGLIVGNDGALYGVTLGGGENFTNILNGGNGTIFRITTNGDFTMLASFNGSNGTEPYDLIQASDGNFYGTTQGGGFGDPDPVGTVFQMTPGGQINTLFRFNGTNGANPVAIMQASDGCLYGTTQAGGPAYGQGIPGLGNGTIFKITTNGDFTLLASFDGTNGQEPLGGLTEVCDGVFYGATDSGGLYSQGFGFSGEGTFFRVTANGDLNALFSFGASGQLPAFPLSGLLKASDGNYYGEAQDPVGGSIFCVRPVEAPVLHPLMQSNQLNLTWNAWAGYSYNVMYETNLTGSNWNFLSYVTPQTNGPAFFSDPIGPDTQRFYEVILQLP